MPRARRALILILLFGTGILSGCRRDSVPASPAAASAVRAQPSSRGEWIALPALASRYGLTVATLNPHGHVRLSAPGVQMTLAAGLPLVRLNGRTHPLSTAPRFRGGVLQVPGDALGLLEPLLRRPAGRLGGVVVLDAGHGGRDPGAVAHGLQEKDLALDIVRRTASRLRERGVEVLLTREGDDFVELADRPDDANRRPGALFVSVHLNAIGGSARSTARGVETYILSPSISDSARLRQAARRYDAPDAQEHCRAARGESLALARSVQASLVRTLGEVDRKVKVKNLAVLRNCYFGPGILTEVGFLTHPETAAKLRRPAYRDRIAEALAEGIVHHLRDAD